MTKFNKFLNTYGWQGFILLLFHPLIFLFTNPIRLVQSLWNCRVLLDGKNWKNTPHFMPRSALTSLFYRTRALNISRFGSSGKSPYLGLGNYDLTRTFHYSLPSLFIYCSAGAVTLLFGMLSWWSGFFLWLDAEISPYWLLIIMFLVLISSSFYSNIFAKQNYNVLGWAFVSIILYAWYTEQWVLATISILTISFASPTVIVLVGLLAIMYSIQTSSILPLFTMIPASLKLSLHLYPFFTNAQFKHILKTITKAIGLTRKNVKYVRTETMKFDIESAYRLIIILQFSAIFSIANDTIPTLLVFSIFLWLVNMTISRFADEQSMEMLILTTATVSLIQSEYQNVWLLASFWLAISQIFPFGRILEKSHLLILPKLSPFNIKPILNDIETFLSPVKKHQRVLMAFDNPNGKYEYIFDRYRALVETIHYVANEREIHLIPDWWGIFELNYIGAKDFWGREIEEVERNLKEWQSDYIVIYQPSGTKLDNKWYEAGFKKLKHFSWKKYEDSFYPVKPYLNKTPDWWLLKCEN